MSEESKLGNERGAPNILEGMAILDEATNISNEKSAPELIALLERKSRGEITDTELEEQSFALGATSMAEALKEVMKKKGLSLGEN